MIAVMMMMRKNRTNMASERCEYLMATSYSSLQSSQKSVVLYHPPHHGHLKSNLTSLLNCLPLQTCKITFPIISIILLSKVNASVKLQVYQDVTCLFCFTRFFLLGLFSGVRSNTSRIRLS